MAKDYAKRANYSRQPKRGRELDILVVIVLVVLFLGGAGYWVYAHKMKGDVASNEHGHSVMKTLHALFHKKTETAKPVKKVESIAAKEEPEVQFNFYNELPNAQVSVAKPVTANNAVAPKIAPATKPATTDKKSFTLQLGVYDSMEQASEARVSYLLSGASTADVVKVGDRYHVQAGPYATAKDAKTMQKKLQKKGIDSTLQASE